MKKVQFGINWIWYFTDTKENAEAWFMELTGKKPAVDTIRKEKTENLFSFRIHK